MGRKRKSRKPKSNNKKIFNVIAIISILIAVIFGIMLYVLGMVPEKYLLIVYTIFIILYLLLSFLVFKKNIKKSIKIFCIVLFIIFDIVFSVGISYISKTIGFIDVINNELFQKEEFYIMVKKDSNIDKIEDLSDKIVGVYSSLNSNKAIKTLDKKVETTTTKYTDAISMFDDLNDDKIDAVLINGSIKNLFNDELKDTADNLKELYTLSVPIKKNDTEVLKVVDITRKPFNIYVAGGDAYGSIDNVTNTDVNMIITVDPVSKKILLTSIPRDYYVNLPSFGENAYDKLTHAGYYGIEESIKAIEKLLDIDINYYVKVNFSTIEGIVDAIDGVDVQSDFNFCVGNKCFKKGINHLDGKSSLTFARERHSFSDGDVQRVKNQQKVIEAIINKVTSSTKLVTNFTRILDSVSSSLSTNMDSKSINKFVKMQLNSMSNWEIESQNLIGTDYSSTSTYTFPGLNLYVMKKNEESVNKAKEKIREVKR